MWHVVHVPTRAVEDARHASRGLTMLQAERTRYRNRITVCSPARGGAASAGCTVSGSAHRGARWAGARCRPECRRGSWNVGVPGTCGGGAAAGAATRTAAGARAATAAGTRAQRLARVRGVAARSATVLADELFSRGLRNRREVGALTGLVSAPYRSGTIVGTRAWRERAAGGAAHRRGDRVGVAAVSTDECARAVVSRGLGAAGP